MSLSSTTYRRIELTGPGTLELVTAQVRGRERNGWALIAPREVGVCRSDLKELLGVREVRQDFGHEIVADVVDCANAGRLEPGDVVTMDPHIPVTRSSGFAELIELHGQPEMLDRALLRLSTTLASGHGIFVEPLACAARCVRRVHDALATLTPPRGAIAIVGAGTFGVLIASLVRAAGNDVRLLNRSRARLDFLEGKGIFSAPELRTLECAQHQRFTSIILATTFAEPELVTWCTEHADEATLITIFGGTRDGMTVGDGGADLDALRRREELREVRIGGRLFWLAGCHGAEREDFSRAMNTLEEDEQVRYTVAQLRGPELSLPEAVQALPQYARSPTFGKPIVVPSQRGHA
ncbi:MAG: alcohol dehydrogenase catalytic domain-containing protein [Pseudonocardiaceae bacterium]